MIEKVEKLLGRLKEVEDLLGLPETLSDQKQYRLLTQEHAQLSELKETWDLFRSAERQLSENKALLESESDLEMQEMLREEISRLQAEREAALVSVQNLLVPADPRDSRNIILELRAGTGGDEAALFVADCIRMYQNYADQKGWKSEVLSTSPSELGGYKEYIMFISGHNVFRLMQYEAGTHRVQRVPETETQGRVHTSAITVAVLPEPDERKRSKSTKRISRSTPIAPQAPAASTSIGPIPPSGSPTFRLGRSSLARKSGASTKIKKKPCASSPRASPKSKGGKPQPKCQQREPPKLEAGTGRKESAPTIFLKTA